MCDFLSLDWSRRCFLPSARRQRAGALLDFVNRRLVGRLEMLRRRIRRRRPASESPVTPLRSSRLQVCAGPRGPQRASASFLRPPGALLRSCHGVAYPDLPRKRGRTPRMPLTRTGSGTARFYSSIRVGNPRGVSWPVPSKPCAALNSDQTKSVREGAGSNDPGRRRDWQNQRKGRADLARRAPPCALRDATMELVRGGVPWERSIVVPRD